MYKIKWSKYLSTFRLRDSHRTDDPRNDFESDFGRVAFSSAMRRLHDKAQVFPLTNGDCIHTRLTHSIEVMNIAHSLGSFLCRNPDFIETYTPTGANLLEQKICPILRTAALVHDIGNPPFGHFGENVIQRYFSKINTEKFSADFTQFDGNAQGLRILTKLMYTGDLFGLNLTCATLGAYMKYPNNGTGNKDSYVGEHKHGVFDTEKNVLMTVAEKCHLKELKSGSLYMRHPLSFLVEAADSISYYVMDIEDAVKQQLISVNTVIERLNAAIPKEYELPDFNKSLNNLNENDRMIKLRVILIGILVKNTVDTYISNLEGIDKGEYSSELLDTDVLAKELKLMAKDYIFDHYSIVKAELTGRQVIEGLFTILHELISDNDDGFSNRAKNIISKSALRAAYHTLKCPEEQYHRFTDKDLKDFKLNELSINEQYRILIDFISGMTDSYAVQLYQELSGQKL